MISYGNKKMQEAYEKSQAEQYSRMSNYGGYGSYRGYRDLNRAVRSVYDNQMLQSLTKTSAGIVTFMIVLFYLAILMKLAASVILLIGTKKVSVYSYLYFKQCL